MLEDAPLRPRRPSAGTLIALIALAVASGGMAYAAIPSTGGVIHTCYSGTGSVRVVDKDGGEVCRASETALTFNQTGPPGPPGEDGEDGEDGLDGSDGLDGAEADDAAFRGDDELEPRGFSEAVSAPDGAVSSWKPRFAAQRSVELPAGRWVITATAVADNHKTGGATFDCRLRAGGKVIDSIDDIPLGASGTGREREAFALNAAARLADAGSAELQCRSAAPGGVRSASITALRVESITSEP